MAGFGSLVPRTPEDELLEHYRRVGMGLEPRDERDVLTSQGQGVEMPPPPSARQWIASKLSGDAPFYSPRGDLTAKFMGTSGIGEPGFAPVDFIPGVGQAFGVNEAIRSKDPQSIAMAMVPGSPTGRAAMGGLEFPAAEAADRLRLKLAREAKMAATGAELPGMPTNERTVITAPDAKVDPVTKKLIEPQLPNFVVGKLMPQDWIARHEQLLSPEEIKAASNWYNTIYSQFLQHTNGDHDLAKQYMRAWLVAQQNVDVGGAMGNMMLQREQILRGVPEEQMKGAGLPSATVAARRVMQNRPIEEGVGQKISDFVDSAEGKKVRSWMGNDPQGGSPFVVDVHTARDTGMVDDKLKRHLIRLGYDEDAVNALKSDLVGTPTPTQYENRSKFGQELTEHLNKIKWQGRSDWTPEQVQAVGWMGMTKLTADQQEDIVSGLRSAARHLSMEVAPGEGSPWAQKYGDRFSALPPEQRQQITHQVAEDAINRVSQLSGVDIRNIVHGTGGWKTFQNPSTVAQSFASKQGAEIAANMLGHLLQQDEVWSNKIKPPTANPKGFAVDIHASGPHNLGTDEGLRDLWGKIMAVDPTTASKSPLFQGYQPIRAADGRPGIRVLIDRGGAGTQKTLESALTPVKKMLESEPGVFEVQRHEAEITKAINDWKEHPNGEGYRQRLVDLLGRDLPADFDTHGTALEEKFRQAIEAAEGKPAAAAAKPAKAPTKAAKPVKAVFGSLAPDKEGQ
jgi:hypothetical protein